MPGKRSGRKQTQKFYCPYCQQRLWRTGGSKYFLYYQGKAEIQKGLDLTAKTAQMLARQTNVCVDRRVWLEEMFCAEDGKLWMHLSPTEEGAIAARLATKEDWSRSSRTPNPDTPNPSVSEFTYRMSRRTAGDSFRRFFE